MSRPGGVTSSRAPTRCPTRALPTGGDRHTAVADLGLDRPDELVLDGVADFEVTDADPAADPCAAVGSGRGDLRGRELRFENGDAPVELCLLLEEVEQRRIVGEVAVLTSISEPLAQLGTDADSQPFEYDAQVFVSPSRDQQAVIDGRCGQYVSPWAPLCEGRKGSNRCHRSCWRRERGAMGPAVYFRCVG